MEGLFPSHSHYMTEKTFRKVSYTTSGNNILKSQGLVPIPENEGHPFIRREKCHTLTNRQEIFPASSTKIRRTVGKYKNASSTKI